VQHANIRLYFGWLGERLLVSPTSIAVTMQSATATKG
jgi:hypothetical protein